MPLTLRPGAAHPVWPRTDDDTPEAERSIFYARFLSAGVMMDLRAEAQKLAEIKDVAAEDSGLDAMLCKIIDRAERIEWPTCLRTVLTLGEKWSLLWRGLAINGLLPDDRKNSGSRQDSAGASSASPVAMANAPTPQPKAANCSCAAPNATGTAMNPAPPVGVAAP